MLVKLKIFSYLILIAFILINSADFSNAANPITKGKALKDFKRMYKIPDDRKLIGIKYIGKVRYFSEVEGKVKVPQQAHKINAVNLFAECGLKIRYTWKVQYHRVNGKWLFRKIRVLSHRKLNKPKKKTQVIDENIISELISKDLTKNDSAVKVMDIKILSKKAIWDFCKVEYLIKSKVKISFRDECKKINTIYLCSVFSKIIEKNNKWVLFENNCAKGGKKYNCHYSTICKKIDSESTIPGISNENAIELIRACYEKEYGLKRNRAEIERFKLIRKLPPENNGMKIPYIIDASVVIDEKVFTVLKSSGKTKKIYNKVRAIYDCILYAKITYSDYDKEWKAHIDSCCSSLSEKCQSPCSYPNKGCKRLGEK